MSTSDEFEPTDPIVARGHHATEVLHALVYFAPETEDALSTLGLRRGRMCYFAGRAAAMGTVGGGPVTAAFYCFNPSLVHAMIPRAWSIATPSQVLEARSAAVDAAYRRLFGDKVLAGEVVREAALLAERVSAHCAPHGRALFAAHADLPWPEQSQPHLRLWHAVTLLREYRGDGHNAALLHHALSGLEAQITDVATGRSFVPDYARSSRGWSEDEWAAGVAELQERLILDETGDLTDRGWALRRAVEADTDAMAASAWLAVDLSTADRLIELCQELTALAIDRGALPPGVFATRPDQF